jgi:hypothetical protein
MAPFCLSANKKALGFLVENISFEVLPQQYMHDLD